MKNRVDIKNFILKIENDFPVNNWKINEIHIWPKLRIDLFFYLINEIESEKNNKQKTKLTDNKKSNKLFLINKVTNKLKNALKKNLFIVKYKLWFNKLPSKKYLFVAANAHRVDYKNKRFNRFFDVIIDRENIQNEAMYFEYDNLNLENYYNPKAIYFFNEAISWFLRFTKKKSDILNLDGFDSFVSFLNQNNQTVHFTDRIARERLESWSKNFAAKVVFFRKTLKKINPKQVAILCYYSDNIMALVVAANQMGITTIEMQHGPQTEIHLAYGNWSSIPKNGYDMLPRKYWNWDVFSKNVLDKWIDKNDLYSSVVYGNPWVDYWKNKAQDYQHKNYILYTLQPNPLTFNQLFSEKIISTIKNSSYKWFLRLHPRQLEKKAELISFLKENEIYEIVDIDSATNDSLPQLLANSFIHFTHCSGSTIEATFYNKPSIVVNPIALNSFQELINAKKAFYINYQDEAFESKFLSILDKIKNTDKIL